MNENVSLCARTSVCVCLFELDCNGCLLVCTAAALNISLQTPFGILPGARVHVLSVAEQTGDHNRRRTWASERCTRKGHLGTCVSRDEKGIVAFIMVRKVRCSFGPAGTGFVFTLRLCDADCSKIKKESDQETIHPYILHTYLFLSSGLHGSVGTDPSLRSKRI